MALLKNGIHSVTFPSSVDYLEKVERITVKVAGEANFDESTIDDLSIATTELFNNAIHHGNKDDSSKSVTLVFKLTDKQLSISVQDEGEGFVPELIRDPLAPENLMAESGRGIYLVRMLMDDLSFNITENGSEIVIKKNLT